MGLYMVKRFTACYVPFNAFVLTFHAFLGRIKNKCAAAALSVMFSCSDWHFGAGGLVGLNKPPCNWHANSRNQLVKTKDKGKEKHKIKRNTNTKTSVMQTTSHLMSIIFSHCL